MLYEVITKSPLLGFDAVALAALDQFPWKGNVRELENLIHHMTILYGGSQVGYHDLPEKYRCAPLPNLPPHPPSAQADVEEERRNEQQMLFASTTTITNEMWRESGVDFNALVNDFETQLIVV